MSMADCAAVKGESGEELRSEVVCAQEQIRELWLCTER